MCDRLNAFIDRYVLPYNAAWHAAVQAGDYPPPFLEDLKALAREEGLWNLFCPRCAMTNPARACPTWTTRRWPKAMGRLPWAAEVFNCSALTPATSSCCTALPARAARPVAAATAARPVPVGLAMSEPDVASSDPTNLQTTVRREGAGAGRCGRHPGAQRPQVVHHRRGAPAVPVAHRAVPQCRRR